jgi:hypothetical protein
MTTIKPSPRELSTDEKLARLRTHRNNISRYRRLLKTQLSEIERGYVLKRLEEETDALNNISVTFPMVQPAGRRAQPIDQGVSHV